MVYGDYVAYQNNGTEVWLYDIKTKKDFQLVQGSIKMEPAIGERGVVWTDFRRGPKDPDIYMYDFKILSDAQITSGPYNHTNPSISEDNIVWTDNRNGHYNVYLYNTTTLKERNITNDKIDHSSPDVSGNNVIYTDKRERQSGHFPLRSDYRKGEADIERQV